MNIMAFSMPDLAYVNPAVYGGSEGKDLVAWAVAFLLFDGKMRGLFSLLFGASMMLIITRATDKGENPATVHYARMFWLAFFGLAHFFLIWWGDILFTYAVIGALAYLFHHLTPKALIRWALIIYASGFLLLAVSMGSMFYVEYAAKTPSATSANIAEYEDLKDDIGGDADSIDAEVALYRGSYSDIFNDRIVDKWYDPLLSTFVMLFETLPLMLLGMAMLCNGFLTGQAANNVYRKWALWCLGGGLIWSAYCAYLIYQSGFDLVVTMFVQTAAAIPAHLLMTIGYAGLLVLLIRRFADSIFIVRVAAAGRAAFTNYLGTSIVMTSIFYGYGLGLYGHFSRAELYLFVLAGCAIMLFWSKPWLERFRYGPLEWLWRSLARRSLQPFKR